MCGLEDYTGIEHAIGTCDMILRFIKDREESWRAKKEASNDTSAETRKGGKRGKRKQGNRNAREVSELTMPQ
jgi:hypothetical protein